MSIDIAQAAISYFGLPEGTTLVEGGPVGAFAFIIPLTEEHLRGIADRMKAMAEIAGPAAVFVPATWREQLRLKWIDLSQAERARFGSFGRYAAQSAMGMAADDAIEPAPADVPGASTEAVWVPSYELQEAQFNLVSDSKKDCGLELCLIQVAMLTDEQRAKYRKGGA